MAAHELVSSCEPCAMCLGATLWSGVRRLVTGATKADAEAIGYDEGPVFPESYAHLERRGIEVVRRNSSRGGERAVADLPGCRGGDLLMSIPRRRLGGTDLEITRVGLGAWAIGGPWAFGWGPQDDNESVAAIHRAVELGINWIDTAAVYGLGHSEVIVGKALAALPAGQRPYLFTKCGLVWDEGGSPSDPRRVLRPASIRRECEDSLRRLGVTRIDLYQFHWPDETGTLLEDSWDAMLRLVEEGKVRWPGVCNFDAALLERCAARGPVASLQPPFSPIRRRVAGGGASLVSAAWHRGARIQSRCSRGCSRTAFRPSASQPSRPTTIAITAPSSRPPRFARNLAAAGRAPPGRGAAPRFGRGDRDRLGAGLAGGDRGNRRGTLRRAGGRMDRGGLDRAHARRPGGDRRCHRANGSG